MRADREPWLVPMRIARFRLLHFSTRGENTSLHRGGEGSGTQSDQVQPLGSPEQQQHAAGGQTSATAAAQTPQQHKKPQQQQQQHSCLLFPHRMYSRSSSNCLGSS